jgi:hypothetical protein
VESSYFILSAISLPLGFHECFAHFVQGEAVHERLPRVVGYRKLRSGRFLRQRPVQFGTASNREPRCQLFATAIHVCQRDTPNGSVPARGFQKTARGELFGICTRRIRHYKHNMARALKEQRIPVMMSGDDVDAIDAWRRIQDDLPSRSEAVRRLVALGLSGKKAA